MALDDPLYLVIIDGKVEERRLHRHEVYAVSHFIHEGEVFRKWQSYDGKGTEIRQLTRERALPNIGNLDAYWSAPLHDHEMPPLLQLYLFLQT